MVRPPAVAGRFYPADAGELTKQIQQFAPVSRDSKKTGACACLVPHAGYMYSGAVAGAVFAALELPKRIIVLGVRHFPRGHSMAILSEGAWQTPLGLARIDSEMGAELKRACPLLHEDAVAHSTEHSLEVQLPFLQVLTPEFQFVPIALGTVQYEELRVVGEALAKVVAAQEEPVLMLTTSDLNHYEDDATTRRKDHKAIEQLLKLDAKMLYDTVRREGISMCGLGPAVTMLVAAKRLGAVRAELVKYATSADVTGDRTEVVGYAGMIFE
jgi:MEMO1 family protein